MRLFSVHCSFILVALLPSVLSAQDFSLIPQSGNPDSGGGVVSDCRAISVLPPETEVAPVGQTDSTKVIDSLDLQMLELEIKGAEEEINGTSLWRRILPQVRISASYGIGNLLFVDFSTLTPLVMPKDDYRLTFSLSLNNILDFAKHSQAIARRNRLQLEYQRRQLALARTRKSLLLELRTLTDQLEFATKEISILRELVRFNELRFEQGKIEYDVLARSKLEVMNLQRNLNRLTAQKLQLLLRLK